MNYGQSLPEALYYTHMQKDLRLYPITIEQCEEGGYFASCDVIPGCHAEGETYAEVIDAIQSVIEEHVALHREHQEVIPQVPIPDSHSWRMTLPLPVKHG